MSEIFGSEGLQGVSRVYESAGAAVFHMGQSDAGFGDIESGGRGFDAARLVPLTVTADRFPLRALYVVDGDNGGDTQTRVDNHSVKAFVNHGGAAIVKESYAELTKTELGADTLVRGVILAWRVHEWGTASEEALRAAGERRGRSELDDEYNGTEADAAVAAIRKLGLLKVARDEFDTSVLDLARAEYGFEGSERLVARYVPAEELVKGLYLNTLNPMEDTDE